MPENRSGHARKSDRPDVRANGSVDKPLMCMKDNVRIDVDDPRCPYPSSQCRFREWCPIREAMQTKVGEGQ